MIVRCVGSHRLQLDYDACRHRQRRGLIFVTREPIALYCRGVPAAVKRIQSLQCLHHACSGFACVSPHLQMQWMSALRKQELADGYRCIDGLRLAIILCNLAPNTTFFLIVLCSLRRLQASIDLQSESRRPRSRQALRKRLLLHNVRSNANAVEPGRWSCKQC